MKCTFFCEPAGFPTLGIEYLISILRNAGHEVDVIFDEVVYKSWKIQSDTENFDNELIKSIVSTGCSILFSYITTTNFIRVAAFLEKVKAGNPDIVTCVGGPHSTYAHEPTIRKKGIDFLCRGEGDVAILEFVDYIAALRAGSPGLMPQGIYCEDHGEIVGFGNGKLAADLNQLPFPDKSDAFRSNPGNRDIYTIASGRGCYNGCTFCNSPTVRKNYRDEGFSYMRRRDVDDIILELKVAKEQYQPKAIWFVDDTFIFNKKYMRVFAQKYAAEIGLPFFCNTIPDFFDEEILTALVAAGMSNVEVGIQSLDAHTRLNYFGRKESNEDYGRIVGMLRKLGVYVNTDHIINPWDSRESLKKQIRLYSEYRPSFISVFHLQYFPDTPVMDHAIKSGFLTPADKKAAGDGYVVNYFNGGSVSDVLDDQHDLIILLNLTPFLPRFVTRILLDTGWHRLLRFVPSQFSQVIHGLSALARKADVPGRVHLKLLIWSWIRYNPTVSAARVKSVLEISQIKQGLEVHHAKLLRRILAD